jgi:hypothetical protein
VNYITFVDLFASVCAIKKRILFLRKGDVQAGPAFGARGGAPSVPETSIGLVVIPQIRFL